MYNKTYSLRLNKQKKKMGSDERVQELAVEFVRNLATHPLIGFTQGTF